MDVKNENNRVKKYDQGSVNPIYICFQCFLILEDVCQTDCGCRCCSKCLDEIYKDNVCPSCGDNFTDKVKTLDKAFMKEMKTKMRVKCAKCDWNGKYENLDSHYDNSHSECQYCHKNFQNSTELSAHVGDEVNGECLEKEYKCTFYYAKCNFTGKLDQIKEHLENYNDHLQLVYQTLSNRIDKIETNMLPSIENLSIKTKPLIKVEHYSSTHSIDSGFSSNGSDISSYSSVASENKSFGSINMNHESSGEIYPVDEAESFETIIKRLDDVSEKQNNLNYKLIEFMEKVEKLEKELKLTRDKLNSKTEEVLELRKSLMMSQVSLIQLDDKLQTLEKGSNNGILMWKISNVKERINDAKSGKYKSLYSPFFYSHQNGYKLSARLFLNGDDSVFGRSLSIFIVICKGEYDQILKWPFKQKITFMLIDQLKTESREHIVQSIRPDSKSDCFKRPITEFNVASGVPTFCSLNKLHSVDHGYMKDDCMFIKISVETHDLSDAF